MDNFLILLALSFLGGALGLVGGLAFLYVPKWSQWLSRYSVSFAAGVLLTVALIGLLPESVHLVGNNAFLTALMSFLGAFLFEHFFFGIHHHDSDHHHPVKPGSVPLIIVGDTVHNLIDGVAIGASFLVSPALGLTTAISSFLHEIPHEIGDFGILLKAGWKKAAIIRVNLVSALVTVIGAFLVYTLTPSEMVVGYLLAIAAGIFLYLGASDFLPHMSDHDSPKLSGLLSLLIGVAIMLLTFYALPHTHEDEHDDDHQEEKIAQVQTHR